MKKALFILLFILSFLAFGGILSYLLGSRVWMIIFLLLSFLFLYLLIVTSASLILHSLGATPVDERIAPEVCEVVGRVSGELGRKKPHIAIMPNAPPNAMLISSRDSYIVLTDEALSSFSEVEIETIIIRTLASDAILKTWVCALGMIVGYPGFLGRGYPKRMPLNLMGVMLMPFLILASLLESIFFSQSGIFDEDRKGATIMGKPDMVARVILRCEGASKVKNPRRGNGSLSYLFLVPPYRDKGSDMFNFHPASERRISKLNEISKSMGREIV
jgi:Zn-dependent protease with chaperone function